jgi:hypothetical protein
VFNADCRIGRPTRHSQGADFVTTGVVMAKSGTQRVVMWGVRDGDHVLNTSLLRLVRVKWGRNPPGHRTRARASFTVRAQ